MIYWKIKIERKLKHEQIWNLKKTDRKIVAWKIWLKEQEASLGKYEDQAWKFTPKMSILGIKSAISTQGYVVPFKFDLECGKMLKMVFSSELLIFFFRRCNRKADRKRGRQYELLLPCICSLPRLDKSGLANTTKKIKPFLPEGGDGTSYRLWGGQFLQTTLCCYINKAWYTYPRSSNKSRI